MKLTILPCTRWNKVAMVKWQENLANSGYSIYWTLGPFCMLEQRPVPAKHPWYWPFQERWWLGAIIFAYIATKLIIDLCSQSYVYPEYLVEGLSDASWGTLARYLLLFATIASLLNYLPAVFCKLQRPWFGWLYRVKHVLTMILWALGLSLIVYVTFFINSDGHSVQPVFHNDSESAFVYETLPIGGHADKYNERFANGDGIRVADYQWSSDRAATRFFDEYVDYEGFVHPSDVPQELRDVAPDLRFSYSRSRSIYLVQIGPRVIRFQGENLTFADVLLWLSKWE